MDRRDFVRLATGGVLGAATAGFTVGGWGRIREALAGEEIQVPAGPESWALSVCTLCPAGCGLRVRKIGGRAVKVQGNPLHPINQGGLCPKGLAALQALYHPDRLRSPMKNIGDRKAPRWKAISWDEAISTLVAQLSRLRAAGETRALVFVDRGEQTLSSRLVRQFMAAYGSPNYLLPPSGLDAVKTAVYLQQGVTQPVACDWDRSRYVLSFGVNLLEGWGSPATIMRAFGRWRDPAAGRRTKFVQIEPRLSVTAARADEWVSLRPGTEAALALGIAYVLITEGLYDAAFVRDHTFGFDDWQDESGRTRQGFRSLVLSEYRLQEVAALTGVPEETILRLAREFGRNRPALALGDRQTSTLPGDPYCSMAVNSLNALAGSVDAPGGLLIQAEPPVPFAGAAGSRWPRVDQVGGSVYPRHNLAELPRAVASRQPYPVQAVILN
ncbi:MAG: molybdopterin-dependent oxidoreductase, partial [Acidobacteria bacterium]|nr:molybdopterin-dependent oxidoreductase [Acidobacteriota bacterium]